MNIQDLGALGELIGGIAVIASVIYLAIQIRHGISGYQSNAIQEVTHHFSILQMEIAKSEPLLLAWMKAEKGEPLTELERRRVLNIVSSYFIAFENLHAQCANKVMPYSAYEARRPVIASFLTYTDVDNWWSTYGRAQFPRDFVIDVDKCAAEFQGGENS